MKFPRIKIRALQAFIAVYEEQSFSRAAQRENTTQSGMSMQVKSLEDVLETQLLIRERKKFLLTPEGEIIYREGQSILKSLISMEQSVREMRSRVGGLVRIGMILIYSKCRIHGIVIYYQPDHGCIQEVGCTDWPRVKYE